MQYSWCLCPTLKQKTDNQVITTAMKKNIIRKVYWGMTVLFGLAGETGYFRPNQRNIFQQPFVKQYDR